MLRLLTAAFGTKRTCRDDRLFVRFRVPAQPGEADMRCRFTLTVRGATDPESTSILAVLSRAAGYKAGDLLAGLDLTVFGGV